MILSSYEVPLTLEGERAEVTIEAPPHLPELVDRMKNQEPGRKSAGERLGLVLEGVGVPRSGTYFDVYAGLPPDAGAGSEDPAGPYHLGTLSSFGPSGAKVQVSYALAPLVERLAREGRWSGELTLTFVRRRLAPAPGAELSEPSGPAVRVDQIRIHRE